MDFLAYYSKQLDFTFSLVGIDNLSEPYRGLWEVEKKQLAGLRNRKRRREWLAGRLAAKKAAFQKCGRPDLCVLNKTSGQPCFPEEVDLHLSITHCGGYAVALVCPRAVGVDLEYNENRPDSLIRYFFTPGEQAALEGLSAPERRDAVTRYWTRKEAVAKALGRGGAISFRTIDTTADRVRLGLDTEPTLRLFSGTFAGYGISIAVEEPHE